MNLIHTTVSARRGSVSWLRLDQTENSNPNIDTGPMNTTPASLTRGGMCSKGASLRKNRRPVSDRLKERRRNY